MTSLLHLQFKLREAYTFVCTLFKVGTAELSDKVISVDQGPPPPEHVQSASQFPMSAAAAIADGLPMPPVETSTPTYFNQPSSSSACSAASSSSAGLSVTRPSQPPEDIFATSNNQNIISPTKNVYAAGQLSTGALQLSQRPMACVNPADDHICVVDGPSSKCFYCFERALTDIMY